MGFSSCGCQKKRFHPCKPKCHRKPKKRFSNQQPVNVNVVGEQKSEDSQFQASNQQQLEAQLQLQEQLQAQLQAQLQILAAISVTLGITPVTAPASATSSTSSLTSSSTSSSSTLPVLSSENF